MFAEPFAGRIDNAAVVAAFPIGGKLNFFLRKRVERQTGNVAAKVCLGSIMSARIVFAGVDDPQLQLRYNGRAGNDLPGHFGADAAIRDVNIAAVVEQMLHRAGMLSFRSVVNKDIRF